MEAAGADAGGGAGGSDDPPESREGQQGQQGLGGEGAEAAVPGEAPRVPGQQQVPGPGGDAFSTVGGPETLIHELYPSRGDSGEMAGGGREKNHGTLGCAGHRSESRGMGWGREGRALVTWPSHGTDLKAGE